MTNTGSKSLFEVASHLIYQRTNERPKAAWWRVLVSVGMSGLGLAALLVGLFPRPAVTPFWATVLIVVGIVLTAVGMGYFSRICSDAAFVVLVNAMSNVQKATQPLIWIIGGAFVLLAVGFAGSATMRDSLELEPVISTYVFGLLGFGALLAQYAYVAPVLSTSSRTNAEHRYFVTLLTSWVPGFALILYTVLFVGKSLGGGVVLIGVSIAVVTSMFVAIAARRIAFRNAFKDLLDILVEMYFAHEGLRRDPGSGAARDRVAASYLTLERVAAGNSSLPSGFGVMPSLDFELKAAVSYARSNLVPEYPTRLSRTHREFFEQNFPRGVSSADGARLAQDLHDALLHGAPPRKAPTQENKPKRKKATVAKVITDTGRH
jgi:hypothetical protein